MSRNSPYVGIIRIRFIGSILSLSAPLSFGGKSTTFFFYLNREKNFAGSVSQRGFFVPLHPHFVKKIKTSIYREKN